MASLYSPKMMMIEMKLTNKSDAEMTEVKLNPSAGSPTGVSWHGFATINALPSGQSQTVNAGLDTGDSTQPVALELCIAGRKFPVTLKVLTSKSKQGLANN